MTEQKLMENQGARSTKTVVSLLLLLLAAIPSVLAATKNRPTKDDYSSGTGRGGRVRGAQATTATNDRHRRLFDERLPASNGFGGFGAVSKGAQETIPMRTNSPGSPTMAPTPPRNITYIPGQLTTMENDLILSQGLTARIIARTGRPVLYANGSVSEDDFHVDPDGADVFEDTRSGNEGGWIYVSNAESSSRGGVGAITFNKDGEVIGYKYILRGTVYNCNGGRTPWNTWVTAEEDWDDYSGLAWEVDPTGVREARAITMGQARGGGTLEAFAYDLIDRNQPRFYVTEDDYYGALERWIPSVVDWTDPAFNMLHGDGISEYLLLEPNPTNPSVGKYSWTTDLELARENANMYYPTSEGIDVPKSGGSGGTMLYFVCKETKHMFRLDLINMSYLRQSTEGGLFEGEPDQLRQLIGDAGDGETMLYFTEDNGRRAGIHARNSRGELITILEGQYSPETTGLSFTPDNKFMYVCFQEDGFCFEIKRLDGLAFSAKFLNVKRNANEMGFGEDERRRQRWQRK